MLPNGCEDTCNSWWRHQMETFSALLAICAGNSPVPGKFPTQRPVTRSFDVFFDLRLNKRLSKQSRGWWFETLSRPLWRHRNVLWQRDSVGDYHPQHKDLWICYLTKTHILCSLGAVKHPSWFGTKAESPGRSGGTMRPTLNHGTDGHMLNNKTKCFSSIALRYIPLQWDFHNIDDRHYQITDIKQMFGTRASNKILNIVKVLAFRTILGASYIIATFIVDIELSLTLYTLGFVCLCPYADLIWLIHCLSIHFDVLCSQDFELIYTFFRYVILILMVLLCHILAQINELPSCIAKDIFKALFVDDLAICFRGRSPDTIERHLQQAVNSIQEFATRNGFRFAAHKCKVVHFTAPRSRAQRPPHCEDWKHTSAGGGVHEVPWAVVGLAPLI